MIAIITWDSCDFAMCSFHLRLLFVFYICNPISRMRTIISSCSMSSLSPCDLPCVPLR